MKKKKIKHTIIGGIGIAGSLTNVCIGNIYCFERDQYIVDVIWFLFGLCAAYACVYYYMHGKDYVHLPNA